MWAARDDKVIFIENPVARVVTDANRAPSDDVERDLREFYRRTTAGKSTYGVDAVRPVTFNNIAVLKEPTNKHERERLVRAIEKARDDGPRRYASVVEEVIKAVATARKARGHTLPLTVICLHDTDNFKCAPDGALSEERPNAAKLPTLVCLGNCGDQQGNGSGVTMPREALERMGRAWAEKFSLSGQPCPHPRSAGCYCAVTFNKPYGGGYEVKHLYALVKNMGVPVEAVQ
eukprot:4574434-Prymnesium_polylepis.1